MNKQETLQILAAISGVFQNFRIAESTPKIWESVLADFTYQDIHEALVEYMRDSNMFAPLPGQLIGIVRAKVRGQFDTSAQAWSEVLKLSSDVKRAKRASVSEPIAKVMKVIGWESVGYASTEELPFIQRRFENAYNEVLNSEIKENAAELSDVRRRGVGIDATRDDQRAFVERLQAKILPHVLCTNAGAAKENQAEGAAAVERVQLPVKARKVN